MTRIPYRTQLRRAYLKYMVLRAIALGPPEDTDAAMQLLEEDTAILLAIEKIRYLRARDRILRFGSLDEAWQYARDPHTHHRFTQMFRVAPNSFQFILRLIQDHTVFQSQSHVPQMPVQTQLAITLYRLGRYGNGASVMDVARMAGVSEGSVELFTRRTFTAIMSYHDTFVRRLTDGEKEVEKAWVERHSGCPGWREGWLMHDGTIIPLFQKPTQNGDAYFTRKSNYGLNAQIGNVPSNLRIVDYSHGMTGSAHDASAFESTAAARFPDWIFQGNEFGWADSAYTLTARTIPVHKKPASLVPNNMRFDKAVASLRVRSEHTMGALKGRWQCLRGLRCSIASNEDHFAACNWITIAIILHNVLIDVEGVESAEEFARTYDMAEEVGNGEGGAEGVLDSVRMQNGMARRQLLIDEYIRVHYNNM
ncbi:hypothetical protein BOTBODRAFT_29902 [Botryobasidium botryosum FD-172 SS1]|uniref:DDE Tnp4 domain-containing protein n=1 Tax=Botryobasidium botryosum (strain FD-172 SS1) TaxID=930990 RepID=A0A067MSS0_BOTB1|nr:hypothetical protein BOTBODRAFT_29902 [Botryobasidium botryosum FD-172 SS1]